MPHTLLQNRSLCSNERGVADIFEMISNPGVEIPFLIALKARAHLLFAQCSLFHYIGSLFSLHQPLASLGDKLGEVEMRRNVSSSAADPPFVRVWFGIRLTRISLTQSTRGHLDMQSTGICNVGLGLPHQNGGRQ